MSQNSQSGFADTLSAFENYKPRFCPVLKTTRQNFINSLTNLGFSVNLISQNPRESEASSATLKNYEKKHH